MSQPEGRRLLDVLFIAVPHAETLEAFACFHNCRGLLHHQPAVDVLIAPVVEHAIQDPLQPEVTVSLLLRREMDKKKQNKTEHLETTASPMKQLLFAI